MKVKYDPEADAVYFYLLDSQISDSDEILPGIVCDFDENDQVVGVEVLSVNRRTQREFQELTSSDKSPLSPQQKKEFREFFSQLPAFA